MEKEKYTIEIQLDPLLYKLFEKVMQSNSIDIKLHHKMGKSPAGLDTFIYTCKSNDLQQLVHSFYEFGVRVGQNTSK